MPTKLLAKSIYASISSGALAKFPTVKMQLLIGSAKVAQNPNLIIGTTGQISKLNGYKIFYDEAQITRPF